MAADKRNAAGTTCSRCWTSLPTPGATHILPTQLTGRWEDVVAVSRPAQAGTDIRRKSSVKTSSGRRQLRRMSRASEDDVTFRRNGGGGRRSRLRMRDGMSPIFCPGQRGPPTPEPPARKSRENKTQCRRREGNRLRYQTTGDRPRRGELIWTAGRPARLSLRLADPTPAGAEGLCCRDGDSTCQPSSNCQVSHLICPPHQDCLPVMDNSPPIYPSDVSDLDYKCHSLGSNLSHH